MFFSYNSAIFGLSSWYFYGNSGDYYPNRLVTRSQDFDAFLKKSSVLREYGRVRHAGAKRSGASRPDQKVGRLGDWVDLLDQPLSPKII